MVVGMGILTLLVAACKTVAATSSFDIRDDLHFPLRARGANKDGTLPRYKNPAATIEDRVSDLLPRMTLEEKVAQL